MAALYMHSNNVGQSSHYSNGASSSNSSASDPSSTGGVITSSPLPQQGSFLSQSQMGQPLYFQDQNSFGSNAGFVGNMDPPPNNFRQHQSSSNFNGGQQRVFSGG